MPAAMVRVARRLVCLAAVLAACGGNRQAPPSLASPSSPASPTSPSPPAPTALATTPAPQPQPPPPARPPSPAAIAEPGSTCTPATGDDNYACTRDGKARQAKQDHEVVERALANPLDNFELAMKPKVEGLMIDRMDQNQALDAKAPTPTKDVAAE